MTTIEEDWNALCKRSQEDKACITLRFFDGAHQVKAVFHEGEVLIHSGCTDGSAPMMAAAFDPFLLLDLLPELTRAMNRGIAKRMGDADKALQKAVTPEEHLCDDCNHPTTDYIAKGDHHGGQKTVCRDRGLCHGRGG